MTQPNKPGPKPKQLQPSDKLGYPVGRDKTVVPPEEVQKLAEIGCKDREIANFFGIEESTLRYNFTAELVKGREVMKITLRRAMLQNATQNMHAAVQIFLAKNLLGMSDNGGTSDEAEILPWTDDVEAQVEARIDATE